MMVGWWRRKKEFANLEAEIVVLIKGMIEGIPGKAAEISIEHPKGGGIEVHVDPTRAGAAYFALFAENGRPLIDMRVGEGSPWEVSHGRLPELLALVGECCRAVIRGNVEEKLWHEGERLVKARAIFWFDGKANRILWIDGILNPFKKRTKRFVRYKPY